MSIIDKLRALNGSPHKAESPDREDDAEHRLNERRLAGWTRNLAIVTVLLVGVGGIGDGVALVTLRDTEDAAAKQATATQNALQIAGQQADAANLAAQTTQQSMVATSRAWVGPSNASITAEPAIGQVVTADVSYQNTGREPAVDFRAATDMFVAAGWNTPVSEVATNAAISQRLDRCLASGGGEGVVFPSAPQTAGYNLESKSLGVADSNVTTGKVTLILTGCFVYSTFKVTHYSTFCYYYVGGTTKIANLSICPTGQRAS